jgi:hypothetical protein
MKKRFLIGFLILIFLFLSLVLIIKIKGSSLLRLYIESGIGACSKIPVLCMTPQGPSLDFGVDREFRQTLIPQRFTRLQVSIPKGFDIVQETVKRAYYKRRRFQGNEPIIYILHQEKDFFVNLFPDLKRSGITNDYEFMRRLKSANIENMNGISDAFFVIMKSIFTPDVGNQRDAKMIEFRVADKHGFMIYNLSGEVNYFDCDIFNRTGGYFKLYIKDKGAKLDLGKVMTIISTIEEPDLKKN